MGSSEQRKRARDIARILAQTYPDARCMLDHKGPFQLLVATILAAQCTDERVNQVTPRLFGRFPDPVAMSEAPIDELEALVRSTGFFRNKAKSIKAASQVIVQEMGGVFPQSMEGLLTLPGVGRKTANVVLGTCFGEPAIIVDTHLRRVVQRLGLVDSDDPDTIEEQLKVLLPKADWTGFSHSVTFHGRRCCAARSPKCASCPVSDLCEYEDKTS